MTVAATKKNVIEALEQMYLYGAIQRWAEPGLAGRWCIWTGEDKSLTFMTGREVLAMNAGVCAALRAVRDGRAVSHKGIYLRAEVAEQRQAEKRGEPVISDEAHRMAELTTALRKVQFGY